MEPSTKKGCMTHVPPISVPLQIPDTTVGYKNPGFPTILQRCIHVLPKGTNFLGAAANLQLSSWMFTLW